MAVSRVIEVSFGRSSVALVRIDTAYFYNNGIIFKPTDIELPTSYQVHWADSPDKATTLETIGTAEGAPIPDDLWNRSRVIYGWIYLHPTEDSAVTAYEVRIYKNVRAGLPDGTEPTPAEQSTIDQLIGALNSAVEQAEDAQEAIENMSVSATTLAEGESATVTKSEQDGVVHLAFGIPKGQTGDDGYSPIANVSKTGKVATITITDKNGTTSARVEDGTDGIDGISPSVSVTDITGGHRVVITDKDGAKSFDVEDGATGATPNLTIGTVTTLEPDASATATITGTAEDPVLNLGIPKGQTGEVTEEEFTQLKEDLNSQYVSAITVGSLIDGYYIAAANGEALVSAGSAVTDFITVEPNHTITITGAFLASGRSVSCYDKNQKWISALIFGTSDTTVTVTIPVDAKYIRFTALSGATPTAKYVNGAINASIGNLQNFDALINGMIEHQITDYDTYEGVTITNTGDVAAHDGTNTYANIKVQNGDIIEIKNVKLTGSRSICAYDDSGNFVKCLATNKSAVSSYIFVVDSTYSNIAVCNDVSNTLAVSFYLLNRQPVPSKYLDSIGAKRNPRINLKWNYGYYTTGTGNIANSSYKCCDMIPVLPMLSIAIYNIYAVGQSDDLRAVIFYDKDGAYVGHYKSSTREVGLANFIIPDGVFYINFNALATSALNSTSAKYTTDYDRNLSSVVFAERTSGKAKAIFDKALKPIITFVDDDTTSNAAITRYRDICTEAGIKGGFAVLTSNVTANSGMLELLKSYEREGFGMYIHCYTQGIFYRPEAANRNLADVEDDFVHGCQDMKEFGFVNWKYWLTPFGVSDADIQNLAKKWGMNCLVSSGNNSINYSTNAPDRFAINRYTFNASDDSGTSLATLKTAVDTCVNYNGWMLVTTHMQDSAWDNAHARFKELTDYAMAAGCEVKTLSEAMEIKRPIYSVYEAF